MRISRPHPFFFLVLALLGAGAVIGALAGERAPSFALYSELIYRMEVAAAVLAAGYALGVMLWLAWHGRTLRRVELPIIGALETPEAELDAAATGVRDLAEQTSAALDAHDEAIAELDARVRDLEDATAPG